jgi:hypothetical protein
MAKTNAETLAVPDELIGNKIYLIRGLKIMLDKDLAELYGVTTGNLNKAVKRNIKRFPKDFMFQIDNQEFESLIFQFGISKKEVSNKGRGGNRKLPFAFTEQGVAMLSGILNSDRAIDVNIQIMRIFTKLRQMYIDTTEIQLEIEKMKKKIDNQSKNTEIVFSYLEELSGKIEKMHDHQKHINRERIGFSKK